MTPLIKAVADGKKEEIIILLNSEQIDINYAIKGTQTTAFLMATTAISGSEGLEVCKLLQDKGADINAKDINGKNALINAIFRTQQFMKKKEKVEHQELCKYLIEQNIDIDYVAPSGMTAFWMASTQGNKELIDLMLSKNVKTDVWHSIGLSGANSALHALISPTAKPDPDYIDLVERAIQLGANINAPDEDGNTPNAIGYTNPIMRDVMLDFGGDVNAVLYQKDAKNNIIKIPAITFIANLGDNQKDLIDKMIEAGAITTFKDTDLKGSGAEPIVAAITASAVGIFESLLNTGTIDVDLSVELKSEKESLSLLSLLVAGAINKNLHKAVKLKATLEELRNAKKTNDENGVTSDLINDEGFQKIEAELEKLSELNNDLLANKRKMFDLLIDAMADVNKANEKGKTPLFFANSQETIEWLLEAGADLFHINEAGDDLLMYQLKNNATTLPFVMELFKEANHNTTKDMLYQLAFTDAKGEYQRELIKGGIYASLSVEDKELFLAYQNPPIQSIMGPNLPLPLPLSINGINYQDIDGNSPLLVACANNNAFLLNTYIGLGANVNLVNNNGESPLMHAIASDNLKMVEFLIEHGADLMAKTNEGKTIVDFAEEINNKEILEKIKIGLNHGIAEGQLSGIRKLKR
jgi:ankyrin repeat protein